MKSFLFTLSLMLICFCAVAQKQEVGFMGGISTYKGELNPTLLDSKFFSPAGGIFYRYNLNHFFSSKTAICVGQIFGDDAKSSDAFNKNRNLSFSSSILDISTQMEFNFLPYEIGNKKLPFAPYIFIGIGIFKFNPQTNYTDPLTGETSSVDLQPLGTEGQGTTNYPDRKEYALTQISIPFGGGLKINVGQFGIGVDIGVRKTFTDYLDDVSGTYADKAVLSSQNGPMAAALADRSLSHDAKTNGQRGNPNDNDWFLFGGLTVYFRLDKIIDKCAPFRHKQDYYN
jgi:hypothetical protein